MSSVRIATTTYKEAPPSETTGGDFVPGVDGGPPTATPIVPVAPPELVKPEPTCSTPGCKSKAATGDTGYCSDTCRPVPPSPAPGVGEGPRELTLAEACEAAPGTVEVEPDFLPGEWRPFSATNSGGLTPIGLARARYRLRPKPLPAPAPRVSRAVQMARNLFDGPGAKWVGPDEMEQHFAAVARETFACIKHFGGDLDRARAAMLEPKL